MLSQWHAECIWVTWAGKLEPGKKLFSQECLLLSLTEFAPMVAVAQPCANTDFEKVRLELRNQQGGSLQDGIIR